MTIVRDATIWIVTQEASFTIINYGRNRFTVQATGQKYMSVTKRLVNYSCKKDYSVGPRKINLKKLYSIFVRESSIRRFVGKVVFLS